LQAADQQAGVTISRDFSGGVRMGRAEGSSREIAARESPP
jgi:hypothetical protein